MFTKKSKLDIRPIQEDPAVVAAAAKVADLQRQEREIKAAMENLLRNHEMLDHGEAVTAVLGGADPATVLRDVPSRTRREQHERELAVVQDALRLAVQAHDAARREAHDVAVEAAAPRHADLARKMAEALAQLAVVQLEFGEFDERLRDAGVIWPTSRGPIGCAEIGDPQDENSIAARWLAWALLRGIIDTKALPAGVADTGIVRGVQRLRSGEADPNGADAAKARRLAGEIGMPTGRARALARQVARLPRAVAR